MAKSDPVRSEFYGPVEACEHACSLLFYVGAALSVAVLFVDRRYPVWHDGLTILFSVTVIALFILSLMLRIYLLPRAEDRRRRDFFANAYRVNLAPAQTDGYYNNQESEPTRKIAMQVLEDAFFTKAILLRMARTERIRCVAYALLWLLCVFNRRVDMDVVLVACQAVFSEQVISRWIRLEWLRSRTERTYDDLYRDMIHRPIDAMTANFAALTMESMAQYETTKANAGITLSSRIFEKLNTELSGQWLNVRAALKL